ncbi:hypothetical protein WJX81_002631 [Elliptochloris bilobata]|uniref:DUF676 domain-containing protein n=1 Tax=Elliptochloris bilobata TaxID=381761 RepID=A0AAW1S7H9_9CHLO
MDKPALLGPLSRPPWAHGFGSSSSFRRADGQQGQQKKHLVLLVNGLFGDVDNWAVVKAKVEARADAADMLLVASTVNSRFKTFEGIDSCGKRLAEEVREYVSQTPGLERISVIGHSMGGLISRYVIGLLYDPNTELICGLRPAHFITLATPHLGCAEVEGPSQVPFMAWMGAVPLMGGSVRMTQDIPQEGYYFSALRSFVSRTCYANTHGDHLVGWANSSLRRLDQLPVLPPLAAFARGVVLEDPLTGPAHDGGSRISGGGAFEGAGGEVGAQTAAMLERLQALPWRRVDVSFRGTSMPFFAHNLIQVTRKWLNWEGEAVAEHLAAELAALEADPRVRSALQ